MSNVVYDKNESNDEIIDFEENVPGTSMHLQSDMDEDGTENSKLHLPEVNVALVPANQSNETPQHPPSPKPLQPLQSTSTSNGQKMDDDDKDSSDENKRKNEVKNFLIRYGLYTLEDGPISQLVPVDIMPLLFPKLSSDPRMELIYDSKADMPMRPRIMLYSNVEYLSKLFEALYWGVDSTPAIKGMGGLHLFTVSKVTAGCKEMMPLVYMVLPNKFMNSYRRAFKAIQSFTFEFRLPEILVVHLRKANLSIVYAARSLYPTLQIKASLTFTSSSFWELARRKVPKKLITNPRTRNKLARLLLIFFLPPSRVYQKFCEMTARPFFQANRDVLTPFLKKFQRLYMGNGDGNVEVIFPSDVWSYYDFFDTTSPMAPIDESISILHVESASPPIENFLYPIIIHNSNESGSESIRPDSQ